MVQVSTDKENRPIKTDTLPDRWLPIVPQQPTNNLYKDKITIVTVLKPSETFTHEWVDKLYRGVKRNLKREFRFVCFSDEDRFEEPIEVIPFKHNWSSKHAKLEVFRPDLDLGRVIYMDLDTVILGDLEDIASYDGKFCMLADFSSPLNKHHGSGFMAWEPGFGTEIYEAFRKTSKLDRSDMYRIGGGRGDQLFIYHYTPIHPHHFQKVYPGQFASYRNIRYRCGMNKDIRVVIFHGKDKPGDDTLPCIKPHWR